MSGSFSQSGSKFVPSSKSEACVSVGGLGLCVGTVGRLSSKSLRLCSASLLRVWMRVISCWCAKSAGWGLVVLRSPFCCAASRSFKPVAGGRSDCLRSVGWLFLCVVWFRLWSARVFGRGPPVCSSCTFGSRASGCPDRGHGKPRCSSAGGWAEWMSWHLQ